MGSTFIHQYRSVAFQSGTKASVAIHNRSRLVERHLPQQQKDRPAAVLRASREGHAQVWLLEQGVRAAARTEPG